jgi:aldehyde:ferredoxin oxidoreductase
LPSRFFQPQTSGALSETALDPNVLKRAIKLFYEMMGWDSEGIPKEGTLHEMDLGWAYKYLP